MTRTPHFDYSSTKGIFNISIRPECLSLSVLKDFISSLETTYLKTISNLTVYPEVIKQSEDMFRDNGRYIKDEDLKE